MAWRLRLSRRAPQPSLPGDRGVTGCLRCPAGRCARAGHDRYLRYRGRDRPGGYPCQLDCCGRGDQAPSWGAAGSTAGLIHVDVWEHEYEQFGGLGRRADCPACGLRRFEFLSAQVGATTASLCGRDAVQVAIAGGGRLDLARLEQQMAPGGPQDRT